MVILNLSNEVPYATHNIKEIMTVRFLSYVIMLVPESSQVIGWTRQDIIDPNRPAHVLSVHPKSYIS